MVDTLLTVARPTDLDRLLHSAGHIQRVQLALPGLNTARQEVLQSRLARALSGCGCTEGSVALLAGLAPAAWVWFSQSYADANLWHRSGLALGIVVAFTLAGKLTGKYRARQQLKREIAHILAELPRT